MSTTHYLVSYTGHALAITHALGWDLPGGLTQHDLHEEAVRQVLAWEGDEEEARSVWALWCRVLRWCDEHPGPYTHGTDHRGEVMGAAWVHDLPPVDPWADPSRDTALLLRLWDAERRGEEAEDELRRLRSTAAAGAAEIARRWDAHCDEEGAGPSSLSVPASVIRSGSKSGSGSKRGADVVYSCNQEEHFQSSPDACRDRSRPLRTSADRARSRKAGVLVVGFHARTRRRFHSAASRESTAAPVCKATRACPN